MSAEFDTLCRWVERGRYSLVMADDAGIAITGRQVTDLAETMPGGEPSWFLGVNVELSMRRYEATGILLRSAIASRKGTAS